VFAISAMGVDPRRSILEAASIRVLVINWLAVMPKIERSRRLS
jgi:hypothetical protein